MSTVAIVVPVYKVEKYLKRCVDSILGQTYQDFELILVDDGSPDQCGDICEEYACQDKRIIVLHRENGGLSAARNTGIEWIFENSRSQYLTFIDSDDWIHPQYLEILLQVLKKNNVAVSVADFKSVKEYRAEIIKDFVHLPMEEVTGAEDFFLNHEWNFNYAWGKLYRREYFKQIRYPEGKKFEDTFTTYKILFAAGKVAFIDLPLYYYFYNMEGISHSLWTPSELAVMDGIREQINFYKANGFVRALEKEERLYVSHYSFQIQRIRENKTDYEKNKVYIKRLRKEMLELIRQNPGKYGYRKMPQCYEAAYPRLMKMYHIVRRLIRRIIPQ